MARLSPNSVGLCSRSGARCGWSPRSMANTDSVGALPGRRDLPDRGLEADARALAVHDPLHEVHVALPVPAVPTRGPLRYWKAVPGLPGAQHRRREPGARGQLANRGVRCGRVRLARVTPEW